jgi:hypothetical protein
LAAILLAELTGRIVLPEINGTSDKAEKLRQALKHTMNTAVTRLETLSEGLPKPFPEPFGEPFREGLPRPAETEPFPKPFREPFATGSVVVEVEVANSPNVVGYLGREREQTQAPPRF